MKLYSGFVAFAILMSIFGFGVYKVDKATDGGKVELTKENLLKELEPITYDYKLND